MFSRGDNGKCVAGRHDVLFICRDAIHKTYHLTLYVEATTGKGKTPKDSVQLESYRSFPTEASTFDEALELLAELRRGIEIDDRNIYTDKPVLWQKLAGDTLTVADWRKKGCKGSFAPVS